MESCWCQEKSHKKEEDKNEYDEQNEEEECKAILKEKFRKCFFFVQNLANWKLVLVLLSPSQASTAAKVI